MNPKIGKEIEESLSGIVSEQRTEARIKDFIGQFEVKVPIKILHDRVAYRLDVLKSLGVDYGECDLDNLLTYLKVLGITVCDGEMNIVVDVPPPRKDHAR